MWRRRERSTSSAVLARRVVGGLAAAGLVATAGLVGAAPASAAAITADVQLASTGLADENNPVGGSVIGIRPGDSVNFTTAVLPTAGLKKLGLQNLLGGLLNNVVGYQSEANFSKLPGGKKATVVKTKPAVKFTFPKAGKYTFTWSVKKLQVGLLGKKSLLDLNLNGNQLEKAGVKLNADNEYVGQVVVSKNPPKGGLSIQLPKVSVEPSVPVVGKLPKVSLPGVTLPTVSLPSVPNLAPKLPKNPLTNPGSGKTTSAPTSSAPPAYELDGPSVPEQVVPGGSAGEVYTGSGGTILASGSSGFAGILPKSGNSLGAKTANTASTAKAAGTAGTTAADNAAPAAGDRTVELAADAGKPSSQLPVVLAILAILALALVAGTYARLFLIKPKS